MRPPTNSTARTQVTLDLSASVAELELLGNETGKKFSTTMTYRERKSVVAGVGYFYHLMTGKTITRPNPRQSPEMIKPIRWRRNFNRLEFC